MNVFLNKQDFIKENENFNLSFSDNTDILSAKLVLDGHVFPNRLAAQAMEGCDGTYDGIPDVLTKRRYNRIAAGGVGTIWFEATAVMPDGRANPRQLYITQKNLDAFKKIF